jgi:hypothetical protein
LDRFGYVWIRLDRMGYILKGFESLMEAKHQGLTD